MEYAQLNETGTAAAPIGERGNIEWDDTHFCPASALTSEEAVQFRVVPLYDNGRPAFDPLTQSCQRNGTEMVGRQWRYKWEVSPLSPEQIEATRKAAIPQSVTMRQARLALLGAGLLAQVATAINALPSPQKEAAQIEWEYSQTVERNRGFVLLLGAALGLTALQLDGLFKTAVAL